MQQPVLSATEMHEMLLKVEIIVSQIRNQLIHTQNQGRSQPYRHESYVQLAISVLAEIGHPTPITVLLERIRERRNDPTITRGSVETSLLRHLNSKGDKAAVVKPRPGTYALRQHVAA